MVGTNLTDEQLQQIVDKTIVQLDKDQDGKISYEEFSDIINKVGPSDIYDIDTALVTIVLFNFSSILLGTQFRNG